MMNSWKLLRHIGRLAAGIAASSLLLTTAMSAMPASAAAVQVVVNGQQMQFDQPPVERAGRVFVPLRGVFEKLGASVAYEHGFINATGNDGKTVSLSIGSRNATVDGNATTLDVAPFTMGGRTLVPLRFVSTALGASVDYAPGTQVVTISNQSQRSQAPATTSNTNKSNTNWILPALGAAAAAILAGNGHHSSGVSLNNVSPSSGSVASSSRPAISGNFSTAVDPNSVAMMLDGNDQSQMSNNQSEAAYVSANNFGFTPTYDLGSGTHTVRLTGRSQSGASFDQSWSFSTNSNSYNPYGQNGQYGGYGQNYVSNVYPRDGSTVGGSFSITGTTAPNARLTIAVTSGGGGFFALGTKTDNYAMSADGRGQFFQNVYIASGSGDVQVQITSNAPYSNASTGTNLTYHT